MSIRRGCCCGGCPEGVDLDFLNVDASICNYGCINGAFGLNASRLAFTSLSLDGSVSGVPRTLDGSPCEYSSTSAVANFLQFQNYALANCAGGFTTASIASRQLYVEASDSVVSTVEAYVMIGGNRIDIFKWSGTAAYGDVLSNQLVCDALGTDVVSNGGVAASGGTVEVNKA